MDGAIWWKRNSMELYQNIIPYSPDGIICHISSTLHLNSILHLIAFTIYDAMLSPSLLCMYTCLASEFNGKFNIHFTWIWPRYTVIGFNRCQNKAATDFSWIPKSIHGKCTNCKWCSFTEFLIHQMVSSVTLT